jgi:hypothetical protein
VIETETCCHLVTLNKINIHNTSCVLTCESLLLTCISEHIISDCCVADLKCSTVFTCIEEMGFRETIYCKLRLVIACDMCSFYDNWSRHVYEIEIILLRNTDDESNVRKLLCY